MGYKGFVIEMPIGRDGFSGTKNLSTTLPSQLIQIMNASYHEGPIRKDGGAIEYTASALTGTPKILGGTDWWSDDTTQRMVVYTDGGNLIKDTGGGDFTVTLKSGLNTTAFPFFVQGGKEAAANNKKLFCFNNIDPVQVLSADGATTSDLATPPADWATTNQPSCGVIHENRLWGFGNLNDPHRGYYSNLTGVDHEDFTGGDAGTVAVYSGVGNKIVSCVSFKNFIIVWKFPVGIFVIDTTDPTVANWKVKVLSRSTGGSGPGCSVPIDDDVVFIDANGQFQLLSSVTEFADVRSRNISKIAELNSWMEDNIDFSRLDKVQSVWYPKRREAHFAMTKSGSSTNDIRIIIDFNRPEIPRFRFNDIVTCTALFSRIETDNTIRLISGNDVGVVYKLDDDDRSVAGTTAYEGKFQTPHDDFAWRQPELASKRKNGEFLELVVQPKGNWNLDVDVYWDDLYEDTYSFNLGVTGSTLGSFVFGTDKLAGDSVLNVKHRITGSGKRFSLVASNSGLNEDFSVSKFLLYFNVGDEKND